MKDRARGRRVRVGNDRGIEVRRLGARHDRPGGDNPRGRLAVTEVHIVRLSGESVETQTVVGDVEPRLAAVPVNDLRPVLGGAGVLERAVVLRPALQKVLRSLSADRKTLELQRVEPLVHRDELVRYTPEKRLAVRVVGRVKPTGVALVGDIGELPVGPDNATV